MADSESMIAAERKKIDETKKAQEDLLESMRNYTPTDVDKRQEELFGRQGTITNQWLNENKDYNEDLETSKNNIKDIQISTTKQVQDIVNSDRNSRLTLDSIQNHTPTYTDYGLSLIHI